MNIYKDLKFTENLSEQIIMGKEIAETYSEANINQIKSYFDKVKDWEQKCRISKEEMLFKSIYETWIYGIRPEQQVYFHLLDKPHEVKKTYMGQMESFVYYARLNRKKDISLFEDKYETYKLLKPYYRRDIINILTEDDYPQYLQFVEKHPRFVVKPAGLHDTCGVELVDIREYDDTRIFFNSIINVGGQYAEDYTMQGCSRQGAVLEEVIEQDTDYGMMSPKSLNAVRVPTIRINGQVHLFGCWIKIGVTDNMIVGGAKGSIIAGVDSETGIINTEGFDQAGEIVQYHPVSKIKIKGFVIPRWNEMVAMIKEIAMGIIPTVNYISWDLALTPNGWSIVEGNFYGQSLWQIVYEKGMKKEFGDLIGWHMDDDKFWWQYKIRQVEKSAGLE